MMPGLACWTKGEVLLLVAETVVHWNDVLNL
jgi:hypothetical protein